MAIEVLARSECDDCGCPMDCAEALRGVDGGLMDPVTEREVDEVLGKSLALLRSPKLDDKLEGVPGMSLDMVSFDKLSGVEGVIVEEKEEEEIGGGVLKKVDSTKVRY